MKETEETYYDTHSSFEPSIQTKRYWRKTRKLKRKYGETWFPGLFNTIDYRNDLLMFWGILTLELIGLYILGDSVNWDKIIFIGFSFAIFMDFVCVFWSHSLSGSIVENKNRRIIANYEKLSSKAKELGWKNFINYMFTKIPAEIFILLIAFGKIYFYVDAKGGTSLIFDPVTRIYDLKAIGVCFIYLLIFFLHIRYTGFALHGFLFKRKIIKEFNEFCESKQSHIDNHYDENDEFSDFQINEFRKKEFKTNRNLVCIDANGNSPYLTGIGENYTLYTWSVFKDDDLFTMAQMKQRTKDEQLYLAITGLKHQLALMDDQRSFKTPEKK